MSGSVSDAVDALRTALSGHLLLDGDPGYDQARSIWNGGIDRRPTVITQCTSPQDVAEALAFAREHDLEISIRGGGHGYAGTAVADGGLMVDLSGMRAVVVNPTSRRARCGGGATWADVDGATQQVGLAVTGGMVSHTGIGGLTLGGGVGWLMRRQGLVIDNLISAEVVLADGRVIRASATEHPDLFWALRGGGGNFGVVTEFEYQLHAVGPLVHMAFLFYPLEQCAEALRLGRDVVEALPPEINGMVLGLNAPPAEFVPPEHHFRPGCALMILGLGSAEEHAAAVAPVRAALSPLVDFVSPIPYAALQQMQDEAFAWGVHAYTKGLYFDELTDDAIVALAEHLPAKTSPLTAMLLFALGGAYSEVGDDETAFGGSRSAKWLVVLDAIAPDAERLAADRAWTRTLWDALRPFTANSAGYINALCEYEEDRVRATYGPAKYERLARIKSTYDPGNIFHLNANIKPA